MKTWQILTTFLIMIFYYSMSPALSEHISDGEKYVLMYFGSLDCGFCNEEGNIIQIKKMKKELEEKYGKSKIKFVMIAFDKDINDALKYIRKYEYWDEISLGERYHNELCLNVLNITEMPGVPHIIVFKDAYKSLPYAIPALEKRVKLVDLVGANAIKEWVKNNYPLNE